KRDPEVNRREFSCRAVNMSARAVTVVAPVLGPVGEHVVADIERFGRLEGTIARVMERGFLLNIAASVDERARIAEKIIWLEENRKHELPDTRQSDRMVPRNPNSTLTLSDGSQLSCFVIDMSATGAAASADILHDIV